MKKYFLYLLKKNLLPLACLTLFCFVLYVIPVSTADYAYWNNQPENIYRINLYLGNISVALGLMSVFIPIYLFSYKMNRRSTDMHYALPLSKTKILLANFLTGLILLYASYTVTFWLGFVIAAIKARHIYLVYYLCLYLSSIIPAFVLFAITAFIYTRANTIIDGIISVALALFVFAAVTDALDCILLNFKWYDYCINANGFMPFAALSEVTDIFDAAIFNGKPDYWFSSTVYSNYTDACFLIGSIIWTLLAAAATVALFRSERGCKAENCGQISESVFCYKVFIPVYTAILGALAADSVVLVCAVAFAAFVSGIIYKRTIKIGWRFAVVLAACLVGGFLLGAIPAHVLTIVL